MAYYYDDTDPMQLYRNAMARGVRAPRRFDEYYRCYPIAMMPGPERPTANHGGKLFLPASALDKLTQLHITYPMLFEVINGTQGTRTHAGVLEFTAEEGRVYVPYWMMTVLGLEPGDLLQCKSTDLSPGNFIKLQPQNVNFLDITDPKAVLEQAFRNFSCLTKGDVFTFEYNGTIYEIEVLEVKPEGEKHAISVQETDLEVDFAAPVGYQEPVKGSGASTPRSVGSMMAGKGGLVHAQGSMAQAINYDSIKPGSDAAAKGHAKATSAFSGAGQRVVAKKGKGAAATPASAPGGSTPTPEKGASANIPRPAPRTQTRVDGPQPLRLPPGKLFFGYDLKPPPSKEPRAEQGAGTKRNFLGEGQSLRAKKNETKEDGASQA